MRIERAIVIETSKDSVLISAVNHICSIDSKTMLDNEYLLGNKILGIIGKTQFHQLYFFKVGNDEEYYGYVIDVNKNYIKINTISNFKIETYNYIIDYLPGETITLKKQNITNIIRLSF